MATSLLASVQTLNPGEVVLLQLVVAPAVPAHPPTQQRAVNAGFGLKARVAMRLLSPSNNKDDIDDQRVKLAEPNFLAVLRVAAKADTDARARQLVHRVQTALGSARSPGNGFRRRLVPRRRLLKRISEARAVLAFPMKLAAKELLSLTAWPLGRPHVAGLPRSRTRHLPATGEISRAGELVIATSNFPGAERPLAITAADACKHVLVAGPTGTGKTALCTNLAASLVDQGFGVIVVETKADADQALFFELIERIPKHRLQDVVIVDVRETAFPVSFNLLAEGKPDIAVEQLCALFQHLYRDTRSVYVREVLYHGLMTLVSQPGYTFVDLASLLMPRNSAEQAWRDELIASVQDQELRDFWQRFMDQPRAQQDRYVQPVMDRIWQLNARKEIRNIIGQARSSFTMGEVLAANKILLVNLSGVGEATASLAGALFMNAIWNAAKATRAQRPNFLFLDEFAALLDLPVGTADLLARARSFNLGAVLATQNVNDLPPDIRGAVMANARTKVVFQTAAGDAFLFARDFGRQVSDEDFTKLGDFEVIARLMTPEGVSNPVTGLTLPPRKRTGLARQVRDLSRKRYGRPVAAVEAEMRERRTSKSNMPKKKPNLGDQKWG
ncbi:energy-coupling factor transporter ATP-binding protein EcfA2 [Kibdelosporangium banguiense]|uniref:Energy-coupling factor transporter ATP-binding protein EcfA2 n=1 Tax=Kibdelosporangium banguiense TaxID=1365924 RepID=A0ABS4TDZ2_9PSEU|nr:energy-coupling factor transporter ATP-binding protein EcfA2 [Kibdelosporangium banguiense]